VHDAETLLATPFANGKNALCWTRTLAGDFAAIAAHFAPRQGRRPIEAAELRRLPASPAVRTAIDTLLADLAALHAAGHEPSLECLRDYPRDPDPLLPTDVYSFHVDRADVPVATILCSYTGAASEGLPNDEAERLVDRPALRAALRERFGGSEPEAFAAWLREHHYDLHYGPRPGGCAYSFGLGNLWRLAVEHPGAAVPPCIHRAPDPPDRPPRLLLIS
jgi:hypothetical protein